MKNIVNKEEIHISIAAIYHKACGWRRHIHQNPELSGLETQTAAFIAEKLQSFGLTPKLWAGGTGVTAEIANGVGPTVVLRADIDALPIVEATGVDFASCNPGVMHACGHDVHAAVLLGAAQVLSTHRTKIAGKVVVLFQPSEEAEDSGALKLIAEGAYPMDAAHVFGLHVSHEYPCGTIALRSGHDYASAMAFDAVISGKGGQDRLSWSQALNLNTYGLEKAPISGLAVRSLGLWRDASDAIWIVEFTPHTDIDDIEIAKARRFKFR